MLYGESIMSFLHLRKNQVNHVKSELSRRRRDGIAGPVGPNGGSFG